MAHLEHRAPQLLQECRVSLSRAGFLLCCCSLRHLSFSVPTASQWPQIPSVRCEGRTRATPSHCSSINTFTWWTTLLAFASSKRAFEGLNFHLFQAKETAINKVITQSNSNITFSRRTSLSSFGFCFLGWFPFILF